MSVAHICHGQDRVGIGVRGAAAFWLGTGCRSHTAELLLLWALFMPGQKTHPCMNNWALMVP